MQMSFVSRGIALSLVAGLIASCQTRKGDGESAAADETSLGEKVQDPNVNADFYSEQPAYEGRMLSGRGETGHLDPEGGTGGPGTTELGAAGEVVEEEEEAAVVEEVPEEGVMEEGAGAGSKEQGEADELGAAGAVEGCPADVVARSADAVGDPCKTTVDFMRELGMSDEQIQRVVGMSAGAER
jgi:hypothetical protein